MLVSIPREASVTVTRYLTVWIREKTIPPPESVVPARTVPVRSASPLMPKRS